MTASQILCWLGFHSWEFTKWELAPCPIRHCQRCDRVQMQMFSKWFGWFDHPQGVSFWHDNAYTSPIYDTYTDLEMAIIRED